jgi:hypothetical protein
MSTSASSSTATVAQELVALCRTGNNMEAIQKLYSPNIVSVEPVGDESMPAEMTGIDAIRQKNEWWGANNEVHRSEVNGPFIGDGQFVVQYTFETTFKPTGERSLMTELALYTVEDGKIVREQFFYNAPNA